MTAKYYIYKRFDLIAEVNDLKQWCKENDFNYTTAKNMVRQRRTTPCKHILIVEATDE